MAGKEQREEKGERGLFVGGHGVFGQKGIITSAGQMEATGLWASGGRELGRTEGGDLDSSVWVSTGQVR